MKAVSDVYAPLSGQVIAVNDALSDSPERINEDPYGDGWLVQVRMSDPARSSSCLTSRPIASCWRAADRTRPGGTTGRVPVRRAAHRVAISARAPKWRLAPL